MKGFRSAVIVFLVACCAGMLASCEKREQSFSEFMLEELSGHEFGDGARFDTVAAAEAHGIDYCRHLRSALRGDVTSVGVLFRADGICRFDAAAADGHANVLGDLFRVLGDRAFSRCLRVENDETIYSVVWYVAYDEGYLDRPKGVGGFCDKYPSTCKLFYQALYRGMVENLENERGAVGVNECVVGG